MDTQVTTDEYTYCWIECSVFGSREDKKGDQLPDELENESAARIN
jgi:hypothetical protein